MVAAAVAAAASQATKATFNRRTPGCGAAPAARCLVSDEARRDPSAGRGGLRRRQKSVALGPFTVHLDHPRGALELTHSDGMRLATVEAAAIGFRQAVAHYDEQYGAFKLSETSEPEISGAWSGLDTANGGAKVDIIDAGGATIGSLALLLVQDSLQLTISAVDPAINRVTIRLGCDDATAGGFLGFGAQTHDVDHRGQIVPIWVSEQGIGTTDTDTPSELWPLVGTRHSSYLPVPQLLAPRAGASYGLRAATFHHSIWDLCATDPARMEITIWEGKVSLSIAPGPTPLEVVAQQSAENGRLPLGPDWTFGLWMERVGGQQAVLDEAALIPQPAHSGQRDLERGLARRHARRPKLCLEGELAGRPQPVSGGRADDHRASPTRVEVHDLLQHLRGPGFGHLRRSGERRTIWSRIDAATSTFRTASAFNRRGWQSCFVRRRQPSSLRS